MARDEFLTDRIKAVRRQHEESCRWERITRPFLTWKHRALVPSANIAALAGVAFLVLSVCQRLIGGFPGKLESPDVLLTFFSTLWQVQAGIAGAALPFLLLVIEFSKDETYATLRSSEVLIRKTYIFPVTCLALAGAIKTGLDTLWYATPGVFRIDLIVFIATAFGTLYAYAKAMELMSSHTRMRREALVVLKERLAASIDASIDGRIGNNVLFKELERLHCEYKIFRPDRRESAAYVALSVPVGGRLTDLNLRKLEGFLVALPRKAATVEGEDTQRPRLGRREIHVMRDVAQL